MTLLLTKRRKSRSCSAQSQLPVDFKSQELPSIRQMRGLDFDPSREIEGSKLWSLWVEDCHKLWSECCQLPAICAWSSVGFNTVAVYLNRLMSSSHSLLSIFEKFSKRIRNSFSISAGGNQSVWKWCELACVTVWLSSCVQKTTWANQLTACKSICFLFLEKSQHPLNNAWMFCRLEHNCAFIYWLILVRFLWIQ